MLGSLVLCVFFSLSCFASPACKVEVVFQKPPKASGHLLETLRKAEAGDRAAQFDAGLAFETGAGTAQDYPEAVKWYRKAANLGYPPAQNNLGGMYLRGFGVAQDDNEALRWYLRAAGEGYLAAENNVGFMHAAGRGAPANDDSQCITDGHVAVGLGGFLHQIGAAWAQTGQDVGISQRPLWAMSGHRVSS